jgi:hypothetical protein
MTTKEEVAAFIAAEFPQTKCNVQEVGNGGATVTHEVGPDELRSRGNIFHSASGRQSSLNFGYLLTKSIKEKADRAVRLLSRQPVRFQKVTETVS